MPLLENEATPPTDYSPLVRRLLGLALWCLSLGIGVVWFNSLPAHSSDQSPLADYTNSPGITLSRANVITFRYHAPHREFVEDAIPFGGRQPTGLTLYLSPRWNQQSASAKARIKADWVNFWSKNARSLPTSHAQPQLVLSQRRSSIWHLSPNDATPQLN